MPAAPDIVIRPYCESDETQVIDLWRASFALAQPWHDPRASIRRKLARQRELFLVAVLDEQVVGTAMAGYDGHRGWVYSVAVRPGMRRRGIGATLMGRVETELAAIGCPKVNLQIERTNDGIVAFYERLGFRVEPRISMGKPLPQERGGEGE